jgi:uncharacterized protein (TIGR00269 family)
VKPFFRFYERDTAAYALIRHIQYIYDECPYSKRATSIFYKELLNQLEARSRGAKQQFYLEFLRARERDRLLPDTGGAPDLNECENCGQPTSAPDVCAFCRLWEVT